MNRLRTSNNTRAVLLFVGAVFLIIAAVNAAIAQTAPARTPSETVREFYKALSEKRFTDALSLSVLKPAIDGLSQQEMAELRPDFEALAYGAESVEITGEQISGEVATVFIKVKDDNGELQPSKTDLMRVGGQWIIGDEKSAQEIKKAGKDYFFNLRITAHEEDAQEMMVRILKAQLVYNAQHEGLYADIPALVEAGLLPDDIKTPASTGYRYHVTLAKDRKSYTAGAEPAVYGRTGRVSFFLGPTGLQKSDNGGKPLSPDKK